MERKYKKMHILFYETASAITMDLDTQQIENWHFKVPMSTNYKTSDQCLIKFEKNDGKTVSYEGYVPDFFPGKHFGDYIELSISSKGIIKKLKPTDGQIDECLKESSLIFLKK